MKQKCFFLFFILGWLVVVFSACNQPIRTAWGDFVHLPKAGWSARQVVSLPIAITDSLAEYDLYVDLRHNDAYRYANLWVFLSVYASDSLLWSKDTLDLSLAHPSGAWLGKGLGDLFTLRAPTSYTTVRFPRTGEYTFTVEQGMRDTLLQGITDVGFWIQKAE